MPSIGSENSNAAYEAYMADIARQKAEKAGGARASGGELVDSVAQPHGAEMPRDVGISGEIPKTSVEKPTNLAQLENNQSFHVALSRLEGSLVKINDMLAKGIGGKNALGGELSRFSEQMNAVEDMMRGAGATQMEIAARLSSHEEQYRAWYAKWEQMK